MKKNFLPWLILLAAFTVSIQQCNPKEKKPGTVLITPAGDTTRVIDTTIIEPGDAPIADNALAKGKHEKKVKEKISCGFGFKKFNNRKRPIEEAPGGVKGKKPKPTPPPTDPPTDPPTTSSGGTIYLDFYGGPISGTMWNVSGSFTVNDAGMSQPEIDQVVAGVKAHFQEYNVTITTDEGVFNATPIGKRVRVVITESWEWYGQAGGVAYLNSFTWTDNSPAFVFSTLLNYNAHNILEAASHEAGHTLELRHQSDCVNGIVTNQYRLGWVMGNSYYVDFGIFGKGTSSLSCIDQDDKAKLTAALGLKQLAYIRQKHELLLRHQTQF